MANEMIKFYRGLVGNLPAAGANGALYITTDEGAIYYGTGTGMKRLGDFVQVDAVANLPANAHESCLYYCVKENILAKWNGAEWKQINKQPTAEEMKTLLGLGSMAYKSEVAEGDLNADLKAKIDASTAVNHSHDNKTVLDGITAAKVNAWDASEGNAKTYADGLNDAMNTRVEALEAIDHEHSNKALLDTYTQTEADLADAVAKKHAHTFNEVELNKIVEGDVAKWNAVVADHLTSNDKTALENSIKEAKKAGTDANTNIETYKVSNDARVKAVEDDIAEITAAEGGILAQAKSYSDGKLATARTEISAEIDADVKVVSDKLDEYKTSNDSALAGVKATAEAAATQTYTDTELAKKVDKVTGYSLVADTEIERLANVTNYDDTKVKEDIAKKADAATMTTELGKKVDKVEGKDLIATSEIERLATLKNYDDTALVGRVGTAEGKITALETASAKHALKTEVEAVDAKFANYKTAEAQKVIDDEQDRRLGVIEGDYLKAADIANFETKANVKKVADDLAAYVESNDEALASVKATAEAARTEEEVDGQIDAKIEALKLAETYEAIGAETRAKAYVDQKFTDANLAQYTTEQEVKDIVDAVVAGAVEGDTVTGLANLVEYINTHGGEAAEMASAIDVLEGDVKGLKEAPSAGIKATDIEAWNGEIGAKALAETKTTTAEVKTQIEAYGYATTGYADGKADAAKDAAIADAASKYETKGTAQGIVDGLKLSETYEAIGAEGRAIAAAKTETENQVKALADGQVSTNKTDIASIMEMLTWGEFGE